MTLPPARRAAWTTGDASAAGQPAATSDDDVPAGGETLVAREVGGRERVEHGGDAAGLVPGSGREHADDAARSLAGADDADARRGVRCRAPR